LPDATATTDFTPGNTGAAAGAGGAFDAPEFCECRLNLTAQRLELRRLLAFDCERHLYQPILHVHGLEHFAQVEGD
jgi:hypothetical protein